MPNSKETARRLFSSLAADLTNVRPELREEVACPLCLRRFSMEAVDSGVLSLEHVIPSALGGTVVTLTCTLCNNTHGSKLDRNLVSAMEALDGMQGLGNGLKAVWHEASGHIAANIEWRVGTDETSVIKIVRKASKPAAVEAAKAQLQDGAEVTFTFNFGFVPEKYWQAAARAAYLAAFERYGYAYVVSDSARLVRELLDHDAEPPAVILQAHPEQEPARPTMVFPLRNHEVSCIVSFR